jgi:hypothetical protein
MPFKWAPARSIADEAEASLSSPLSRVGAKSARLIVRYPRHARPCAGYPRRDAARRFNGRRWRNPRVFKANPRIATLNLTPKRFRGDDRRAVVSIRTETALNRGGEFTGGVNTPSRKARLGDDHTAGFRHRHQMSEHARLSPSHRPRRRTHSAILAEFIVFHEQDADAVRPEVRRKAPVGQPLALEIAAHLRAFGIDAAAGFRAMIAFRPRGFFELRDFQCGAAHCAGAARLSDRRGQ